jgi:hypothetical protein
MYRMIHLNYLMAGLDLAYIDSRVVYSRKCLSTLAPFNYFCTKSECIDYSSDVSQMHWWLLHFLSYCKQRMKHQMLTGPCPGSEGDWLATKA